MMIVTILMALVLPIVLYASAMSNEEESYANGTSVIPPTGEHKATMIFLHGFGESVDSNWMPVLLPLSAKVPGVKWILPQAPMIPSTYNNGTLFPAWFDTPTLDFLSPQDDIPHQDQAIKYLISLIKSEYEKGVEKVMIGGYSQGATIAFYTALTAGVRLNGLAVIKGWVARSDTIHQQLKDGYKDIPTFWAAGQKDDVVTPAITLRCVELIVDFGMTLYLFAEVSYLKFGAVFKYYEGAGEGHAVGPEEMQDMIVWLQQTVRF